MPEPPMQFLPGSIALNGNPVELSLWESIKEVVANREGYLSYRIPLLGENDPIDIPSFVLIAVDFGIVLIDVVSDSLVETAQDNEFWITNDGKELFSRDILIERYNDEIRTRLKRGRTLYDRRTKDLTVSISSCIVLHENTQDDLQTLDLNDLLFSDIITKENPYRDVQEYITNQNWPNGDSSKLSDIISLLEGTYHFRRSRSSRAPAQLTTMQDFVDESLRSVFKQDSAQRQISMQIPPGPQRIRGLAGTGKTVVLCLKAALTALNSKEFRILYIFNTQSLYNMIEKWIGDYYAREAKSAIDWKNVDVLHAWGGRTTRPGLYFSLCEKHGLDPLTWDDVRHTPDALSTIYSHLLDTIGDSFSETYDMVLIDEAQDFPPEVFQVVYRITKHPKRIIWAYDDFQSLTELRPRGPEQLFGKNKDGQYCISSRALEGEYAGGIKKDFVLANCYRNPRITLMVAHGIALGIYSPTGLVDSIDHVNDWHALGYKVVEPANQLRITAGDHVVVERPDEYSRNNLEQLLHQQKKLPHQLIQLATLDNVDEQEVYIATNVSRIIDEQGVPPEEIIVITLDTRNSHSFLKRIRGRLDSLGISSILPGIVERSSDFKAAGRVTLTTPFRAKGNEANIVFVANCQSVPRDQTFRKRDEFFVSVTRSRGWTYLTGMGKGMKPFTDELETIKANIPRFEFDRPNDELINRRRNILSGQRTEAQQIAELLNTLREKNPDLLREQLELILRDEEEDNT